MTSVYVLSGFLGAGKTSLLQHILSTGSGPDTVVFVNEFGRLGLDGRFIQQQGLAMYELNSGCICCTLQDELEDTLLRALHERKPAKILIEASGVADPAGIARTIARIPSDLLSPAKIITVIDARSWLRKKTPGQLCLAQLSQADLVVLNKTDLVPVRRLEELQHTLEAQVPGVEVIPTVHGRLEPSLFWACRQHTPVASESTERESKHQETHEHHAHEEHHHEHEFSEVVFSTEKPLSHKALDLFLANLPSSIVRAKGQVIFPEGRRYLDVVDGQISWRLPPDGLKGTCLVFIGKHIDEQSLREALTSVILPD